MRVWAGVWIDNNHAIIVKQEEGSTEPYETVHIQYRSPDNTGHDHAPYGQNRLVPERSMQNRKRHHLNTYYNKVINSIKNEDEVIILGPGRARFELEKELKKNSRRSPRIVCNVPHDRMSIQQIAMRVQDLHSVPC